MHVVQRASRARMVSRVIVATDDQRIVDAVLEHGGEALMTSTTHESGTDRIAEVAAELTCELVVNVQGDEPLIDHTVIDAAIAPLVADAQLQISTTSEPITAAEDVFNPNVVKVVVSGAGRALYFSRRTIPYLREAANCPANEQLAAFPFLKHLGIYGYRRETLLRLVKFPVSPLENAEKLEQLRALENGIQIAVVKVDYDSVGVDVPEDVARVEKILGVEP